MATGRERLKVSRHTKLWMGSINLRFLCKNLSLHVEKNGIKKECVNLLCASVPGDDCGLFLDAGSYFVQLVGGRISLNLWESSRSRFTESQNCYLLLF